MRVLLASKTWYYLAVAILIGGAVLWYTLFSDDVTENLIITTVDRGTVTQGVSVSGAVEAKNTAELAFPTTGKVIEVFVEEGAVVAPGEVLATLGSANLAAQRTEAAATLRGAQAQLDETIA